MRLMRGRHAMPPGGRGCVLSIGNFDGVHRGHQALLNALAHHARRLQLPAVVMSFEPTPREFFAPQTAPPRVFALRDKLAALAYYGADALHVLRFNRQLASLSAEGFVQDILVAQLGVKCLVVGDDFRFGAGRSGTVTMLRDMAPQCGFSVVAAGTVTASDGLTRCSSTALRGALVKADLPLAAQLLGRPYQLMGRVRHGKKLARTLGMPTANLPCLRPLALQHGVYAIEARVGDDTTWQAGVAALGVRPAVGGTPLLLEVHFFDQNPDLYGALLTVRFCHFLRPEAPFASLDALQSQMHADAQAARALLLSPPHG